MHERSYRTELSPVSFLRRSAYVFPEKIAVVHGARRYCYRTFAERANRLGSALRSAGIEAGDRVAFLSPNTPAMLEAHYGVPAIGAVLVPVNTRLAAEEIRQIVARSGARLLFADHELVHLVETVGVDVIRIDDTGAPGDPYEDFLAGGSPEQIELQVDDEEQTISINYTSGTTGAPKGVMTTHRGSYLNALMEGLQANLRPDSVQLWVVPMFHCNGWCFTWAVTALGGRHVCMRKVDPALMWELFETEGITHYNAAPTVHINLVHHPAAHRLEHEVVVTTGGSPPSPTLLARMAELNLRPVHAYGLTETYAPYTVCEPQEAWSELDPESRAGRFGRQGVHNIVSDPVRVVDEQMRDVPRDGETPGEILMRGNNVMKGYFDDPDGTATAFEGGWFHSGDIAVMHPDGYIEIRDRKKDVIVSGGENISTIEVEYVIARHPAVLECAVVAMPDERWGERPKAFVTLKDGETASGRELIDFCRDQIAHYKCPAEVEFCTLPKTSTGKVQKYVLREREWAGHDGRVH